MEKIKEKVDEIEKELEKVQSFYKDAIIPLLREIDYIQFVMQVNLGLCVILDNYWAPTRYYLGDINFHPNFGVKRFKNERCDENLSLLLELVGKTDEILGYILEKIKGLTVPTLDLAKCKLLSKLL